MKRLMILMAVGACLLLGSCTSSKKLVYLQTSKNEVVENQAVAHPYQLKIQNDDLLYISLSSKDAELVEPFKNSTLLGSSTQSTNSNTLGFLVDSDGYISIPSLGKIYVRGLSCTELASKIEQELVEGNFIKDPVISVRLGNFKVTVLGEVNSPGAIEVDGNRLTILEAISRCGDLKPTGKRKNIKILREQDGKQNIFEIDLTKANITSSPYYYLCQNDVVYVEPNKSLGTKSSPWSTIIGVGGTVLSLVVSIITLATVTK